MDGRLKGKVRVGQGGGGSGAKFPFVLKIHPKFSPSLVHSFSMTGGKLADDINSNVEKKRKKCWNGKDIIIGKERSWVQCCTSKKENFGQ